MFLALLGPSFGTPAVGRFPLRSSFADSSADRRLRARTAFRQSWVSLDCHRRLSPLRSRLYSPRFHRGEHDLGQSPARGDTGADRPGPLIRGDASDGGDNRCRRGAGETMSWHVRPIRRPCSSVRLVHLHFRHVDADRSARVELCPGTAWVDGHVLVNGWVLHDLRHHRGKIRFTCSLHLEYLTVSQAVFTGQRKGARSHKAGCASHEEEGYLVDDPR